MQIPRCIAVIGAVVHLYNTNKTDLERERGGFFIFIFCGKEGVCLLSIMTFKSFAPTNCLHRSAGVDSHVI